MKLSQRLLRLKPSATRALAEKAKALKAEGVPIVSFTTGEPDFRAPEASVRYAAEAMAQGKTFYTATAGLNELKTAVRDYYARRFELAYETDQIIIAPGAKPLIFEALGALIDPGDEVILAAPSWVSYVEQIRFFGGTPVIVESRKGSFELDMEKIRCAVSPKTAAIIVNSPHNPTGVIYGRETMTALCSLAQQHDFMIINDEIYERITFDGVSYQNPLCYFPAAQNNVLTINGVSKAYAMTGWRIGFALGPKELVKKIGALQGHLTSSACSVAQWAAVGAIREAQPAVEAMVAEYQRRKNLVVAEMDAMPLVSYAEPKGAFYVFMDVSQTFGKSTAAGQISDDVVFARQLLELGHVAVVPGSAFLYPGYVRLSFATSRENIKTGMQRIKAFLANPS